MTTTTNVGAAALKSIAEAAGDLQSWTREDRTVPRVIVHALFLTIAARSSDGRADTTLEQLAGDCGISLRAAADGLAILRELDLLAATTTRRRGGWTVYAIRLEGVALAARRGTRTPDPRPVPRHHDPRLRDHRRRDRGPHPGQPPPATAHARRPQPR